MKTIFTKPHLLFFGVGVLTLVTAVSSYIKYPDSLFDFGKDHDYSIGSHYAWGLFSVYVFGLAAIYYTAARGGLRIRTWLAGTHIVFIILFLLFFSMLSVFSSGFVQDHVSGLPLFTVLGIYATLFILDLFSFIAGLLLLVANMFSFRRKS